MKYFLDSSVLVPAFYEDHEHHELSFACFQKQKPRSAGTAAHCLTEIYSVLTGRPGRHRVSGEQALLFLGSIRERLSIITLDDEEYFRVIQEAAANRVVGATIHDAIIAGCATKAKAQVLYTWNTRHFKLLGDRVASRIQLPPAH